MDLLMLIAIPSVMAALVVAAGVRRRRAAHQQSVKEVAVTLSVVSRRTAVVVLDMGSDAASAASANLVEHAVRDAFGFHAVDVVEVRRHDGELLDRRHRDNTAEGADRRLRIISPRN
jgi:hypothetical protein